MTKWEKREKHMGFFYMIKTIYPMCFNAKPSYYIFIQSVNLFNGLFSISRVN